MGVHNLYEVRHIEKNLVTHFFQYNKFIYILISQHISFLNKIWLAQVSFCKI